MFHRNFFQFRPIDFRQQQETATSQPAPPSSPSALHAPTVTSHDEHHEILTKPFIQHHSSNLLASNTLQAASKWKKSLAFPSNPADNADPTGSVLNLSDLSSSNAAFLGTICLLGGGFVFLIVFASVYYYRKRGSYHDFSGQHQHSSSSISNHKVLLLKKDIQLDKSSASYAKKKTPAVRSPSSSQVNPFNKKSPSPTSAQLPSSGGVFSPNENKREHIELEGVKVIHGTSNHSSRNNSKHCSPIEEVAKNILNPIENIKQDSGSKVLSNGCNGQTTVLQQQQQQQTIVANNQSKNLGKLHFKLKYNYEKRALCLVIIRCTDLPLKDNGSTLDPYVKMQLLPEKQHKAKTRVLRKSQNPVYNEEFTFYGITSNLLENLAVHFVVLNFDRFSRDEILGEVVCRLNQFEFDSLEKQITLCRDISPCGNKLKIQDLGELLVSLCYQPIANRLTVVILKARNLPKMDLTGLCDPYVKIYVFHNNERISKKRTHIKKRTLSPVFNESFIFDIPPEEGLDNIRLQFMVYDHDRVTRNELIGKVEIGSKTGIPGTEKHWHEVIKSPRRQIAEWHKLRDASDNNNSANNNNQNQTINN